MSVTEQVARLTLEVQARYLGFRGLNDLLGAFDSLGGRAKMIAAQSAAVADKQVREAARGEAALKRSYEAISRAAQRDMELRNRYTEAVVNGNARAALRIEDQWK